MQGLAKQIFHQDGYLAMQWTNIYSVSWCSFKLQSHRNRQTYHSPMNVKSELYCPVKNRSDPEAQVLWCLESSGVKGCDVFPHLYSHHPSHPESGPGPGVLTRKLRCGVWGHSESGHYIGQENQYCFISSDQQIIKSSYWESHNKNIALHEWDAVYVFFILLLKDQISDEWSDRKGLLSKYK